MDYRNIAEVTSVQSAIYVKFGRSKEKVMACISLGLHAQFPKVWLRLNEKLWEQQPFENVNTCIRNFANCTE